MIRIVIIAALALAACKPTLAAQSVAPPGRSARLVEVTGFWGVQHYTLELSQGVAIAVTCHKGGPCAKPSFRSDDPEIAEVRLASLARLEPVGYHGNQLTSSAFVVVGRAPGTTRLRVTSGGKTRDVVVTVVPPPVVAAGPTR